MSFVTLSEVSKAFPPRKRGGTPLVAVDGVSLSIERGEIFGIIGYSGAGKSTLVRLINALEPATSGTITIGDLTITDLPERGLRRARTEIGMIFQQFNLLRSRTAAGNVSYPLEVLGVPKDERAARVQELLDFVGLGDRGDAYPEQLSGGQKQRVGIARALAGNPPLLLADEATSALDPETTHEVLDLLRKVNRELGVTIIVITHEMEVITSIANKVAVMEQGRVVESGTTFDVFTQPQTGVARRFVQTVVPALPSGEDLALLRQKHPGRFVTFAFRDDGADQSSIFRGLASAGIDVDLVHGGVHDIQGRTFGLLTLALRGDDASIDRALQTVDARVTVTEAH